MRKILSAYLFLFMLALASPALAFDKPAELAGVIRSAKPYGSGNFTKLLLNVYDADFWMDASKWSWSVPFALTLHYHMTISKENLSEKSVEQMDNLSQLTNDQKETYGKKLSEVFPDVKEGDEITALWIPDKGIHFYFNGVSSGTIADLDFAKRFFSIWLSDKTSAPDLRSKLLALSPSDQGVP